MTLRSTEHLALAYGACVIVDLADADAALARLDPIEQQRAGELPAPRRRDFIAGRSALHLALPAAGPILSDPRGAPILPAGWVGSISHKGTRAAALVAPVGAGRVGLDLEVAAPPRQDIAARILTPREQAQLPDRGRAVTLRFSIKEAIYKALDPYLHRYVSFLEVELDFVGDQVSVTTALPFAIEAAWREHAGHWLTTARARPVSNKS